MFAWALLLLSCAFVVIVVVAFFSFLLLYFVGLIYGLYIIAPCTNSPIMFVHNRFVQKV
jgi:type IV secretory pathway VirB6-like protein